MKVRVSESVEFSGRGMSSWGVISEVYTFLSQRVDKAEWKLEETSRGYDQTSDYRLIRYYEKEA